MVEVLNSTFFYYFFIVGGVFLMAMSILLYVGIKNKGRVLLIDKLFKKKEFNREELKSKYTIQAYYTGLIGLAFLIYMLAIPFDGVISILILIVFGIFDFIYDYTAIKSAARKPE